MRIKIAPMQAKAGPEDGLEEGEFIVYPSTFTKTPDSYGDIVAPGAFLDTIKEWEESGNVLPGLYGHRFDDPDYFVASATEMGEDDHGWWVKGQFDLENPKAKQVYRLVKGRRLSQLSFAYDVLDGGSVTLEGGDKAYELRKLKVYEFSFVPIGANQDTSVVAVKAAADVLVADVKAGRVLAKKHVDSLRSAQEAIGSVLTAMASDDQEKATGRTESKPSASDEEPATVKSPAPGEDSKSEPSVDPLAAIFDIYATAYAGQEGA